MLVPLLFCVKIDKENDKMTKVFQKLINVIPVLSSNLTYVYYKDEKVSLVSKKWWNFAAKCAPILLIIVFSVLFEQVPDDIAKIYRVIFWILLFILAAVCIYIIFWFVSVLVFAIDRNKKD